MVSLGLRGLDPDSGLILVDSILSLVGLGGKLGNVWIGVSLFGSGSGLVCSMGVVAAVL